MRSKDNAGQAAAELEQHFQTQPYAHALVLERLPSGEYAWLKPADDEPRYVLTAQGRRALHESDQS